MVFAFNLDIVKVFHWVVLPIHTPLHAEDVHVVPTYDDFSELFSFCQSGECKMNLTCIHLLNIFAKICWPLGFPFYELPVLLGYLPFSCWFLRALYIFQIYILCHMWTSQRSCLTCLFIFFSGRFCWRQFLKSDVAKCILLFYCSCTFLSCLRILPCLKVMKIVS